MSADVLRADPPALPMFEVRRRAVVRLRHAQRPLRAYDLAGDLGVAYGTVLRVLDWLAELGLVTVGRDGWEATGV